MNEKTDLAINFLRKIRKYLENEELLTMLSEITEDAHNCGEEPDPFRILISTVLSVRNKDESTAIATKTLFDKEGLNTPDKILNAPIEQVQQAIKKSGMYITKTERIKEISRILIEEYDRDVPKTKKELMKLPGVGPKVANCVLVYAYNKPAIPVDTHVHRISNRMGLVKTSKPEKTEEELEKIYPKEYWCDVNDTMVIFGKTVCRPISPKCDICPITNECPKIIKKRKKKSKKSKKKSNK